MMYRRISRLIEEQALMPIVPIVPAAAEGVIIVKNQSLLLKYGTWSDRTESPMGSFHLAINEVCGSTQSRVIVLLLSLHSYFSLSTSFIEA